jgi:hypothetical protein
MRVSAAAFSMASLCMVMGAASPAQAQTTIFNTDNFREDSALWTDPAYYRNNSVGELREMQVEVRYGEEGEAVDGALDLASPYPYTSAAEHYAALLAEAGGGTRHTPETILDWRGRWEGGGEGLNGGDNPASAVAAMLTPQHQEYFVQAVKAAAEGRDWWAGAFCLPGGFLAAIGGTDEFIVTPEQTWILGAGNGGNYTRWVYTDGSGHVSDDFKFAKWHGESIGFWDGDTLVIHTNQIRGWKGNAFEFTDALETVERYRRNGDVIEGEMTLYDPAVFVRPYHTAMRYERVTDTAPEFRPLFNSCTDTNGPSSKVYVDENGFLNERLPGEPNYWDATDAAPWRTFYKLSDERYERYRAAQRTAAP